MMMTVIFFFTVLMVGLLLSGVFFRYIAAGTGVTFGSLSLSDVWMAVLNVLLMVLLLMWALVLIQ
ncbi:hypothetical protein [Lactiplantibacillus plajomi]|uniref:Integral membrane protein n=1 Tax=Lactiplantibacillus plajomi TaxID=1457217 RepID=A0ABV6K582_9LACO|nr:hypothetical protein [Lactiplantibacillus plajomi]